MTVQAKLRAAMAALIERAPVRWIALLLVMAATIGTGVYNYRQIDTELTAVALSRREAVAQLAAATLAERFGRVVDVAVSLSTRVKFRDLVAQGKWVEAIEFLRAVPRDLPHIERLVVVDLEGTLQADVPALPGVRGKSFAHREWFQGVSREWHPYVSPVYTRTAAPQRNVIGVAVPIRNAAEQVVGILLLQIPIERLLDRFESIAIGPEESIYVVDSKGQLAFHSKHPARGDIVDLSMTPVVEKLRRGERGVEIGLDPVEHEDAIIAYAAIPGYSWGVVAQQPVRASGLAARDNQLRMLLTGYGLLLLLGSGTIFLVSRITDIQLRQAKDEQHMGNLRLANIVNNAADAIISVDENQRIVQFNRGAETIFGYRAAEILGEPLDRLLPSHLAEVHRRHVAGFAAGDDSARHMGERRELAGRRKDGSEFPAEATISKLSDHGRTILTAIMRDVSARKRAEQALREKDILLTTVGSMAKVGGWEFDTRTRKGSWTDEVARIHDMDPKDETSVEIGLRFFQGESRKKIEAAVKDAMENSKPYDLELEMITAKGNHKWVRTIGQPIEKNGTVIKLMGSFQDITERRRAEEEIRQLNAVLHQFKDTLDQTLDCVFMFQPDTLRFTYVNEGAKRQVGYSEAEMLQMTPVDIKPEFSQEQFQRVLQPLIDGVRPSITLQTVHRHKNGHDIPVEIFLQLVRLKDLEPRFVAMVSDITERKRAEDEIHRLNTDLERKVIERTAQLEAANKELESFSYSVSHDLRAPLRGIDGFSQALVEDYADKLDDQGKGYLQRVRAASQRMAELIDDMLKLARVTRAPLQRQAVDLSSLAHSIIAELQRTQPQRSVDIVIEPDLNASGDPRLLRVLLENLLGNAWKFTGKQPRPRIELGARHDNGMPVYFVRDNGAGFDIKYAHKLFGAFQRLHTVTEFPGTGIGLATVQRIVHRHGGRAWAEGAEGHGATFFFTLSPEPAYTPA
jgi:PAS domain S-box-containing protein